MEIINKDLSLIVGILEDIAAIKDINELVLNIFLKLRGLYNITLFGIGIIPPSKENIGFVLFEMDKEQKQLNTNVWIKNLLLKQLPFDIHASKSQIIEVDKDFLIDFEPIRKNGSNIQERLNSKKNEVYNLIPMKTRGELIGVLLLETTEYHIDKNNYDYTFMIANLLGSTIKNGMAFHEVLAKEKEKEIQINLLNELITVKDNDLLYKRLIEGIDDYIRCDYLAVLSKHKSIEITKSFSSIKDSQNKFNQIQHTRIVNESLELIKATLRINKLYSYSELYGNELNNACKVNLYLKKLVEKYLIQSFLVIGHVFEDKSDIYMILGRKDVSGWLKEEKKFEFMMTSSAGSFFTNKDIEFSKVLIPQLGLILENLYSFNKILSLSNKLEEEKNYLLEEINLSNSFEEIIGTSKSINLTLSKVRQVAPLDATVLILGETGTGKELIAKAIHNLSKRKDQAFITINCAALPAHLIESELFGHEKGSFTGAIERRIGKFEIANHGTIFLDEIGELPMEAQSKLLRVLQEKEFERIGAKSTVFSDVRIIAATNRNLEQEIVNGKFRADLFFRLNVFPIKLDPLKERKEDIPLLMKHFIDKYSKRIGKENLSVKKNDMEKLNSYNWPGNIRELEHIIERAIIISKDNVLEFDFVFNTSIKESKPDLTSIKTLEEMEKEYIMNAIKIANGKITGDNGAAQLLGLNGKTLGSKMKRLGIKRKVIVVNE